MLESFDLSASRFARHFDTSGKFWFSSPDVIHTRTFVADLFDSLVQLYLVGLPSQHNLFVSIYHFTFHNIPNVSKIIYMQSQWRASNRKHIWCFGSKEVENLTGTEEAKEKQRCPLCICMCAIASHPLISVKILDCSTRRYYEWWWLQLRRLSEDVCI